MSLDDFVILRYMGKGCISLRYSRMRLWGYDFDGGPKRSFSDIGFRRNEQMLILYVFKLFDGFVVLRCIGKGCISICFQEIDFHGDLDGPRPWSPKA